MYKYSLNAEDLAKMLLYQMYNLNEERTKKTLKIAILSMCFSIAITIMSLINILANGMNKFVFLALTIFIFTFSFILVINNKFKFLNIFYRREVKKNALDYEVNLSLDESFIYYSIGSNENKLSIKSIDKVAWEDGITYLKSGEVIINIPDRVFSSSDEKKYFLEQLDQTITKVVEDI